jgi:hypothetical protein
VGGNSFVDTCWHAEAGWGREVREGAVSGAGAALFDVGGGEGQGWSQGRRRWSKQVKRVEAGCEGREESTLVWAGAAVGT